MDPLKIRLFFEHSSFNPLRKSDKKEAELAIAKKERNLLD